MPELSPSRTTSVSSGAVLEHGLDGLRGDLFAVRQHQDVFLAVGDLDIAFGVNLADVAGMEPAVRVNDFCGCLRVVPVAAHDRPALDQQLAVGGGFDLDARPVRADRADLDAARRVRGRRRRGFGQAPAFQDRDADGEEEVARSAG